MRVVVMFAALLTLSGCNERRSGPRLPLDEPDGGILPVLDGGGPESDGGGTRDGCTGDCVEPPDACVGDCVVDIPDACTGDCRKPICGDGVLDAGEECDDGNTGDGDGCSASCEVEAAAPSAFRVTELQLVSPRVVVDVPVVGCRDVTQSGAGGFAVNQVIRDDLDPMTAGGDYALHLVSVFRPRARRQSTST
jgi:cysteine-rich repeat protein